MSKAKKWIIFLFIVVLIFICVFFIRKASSKTYSNGYFSDEEPGILLVSYDPLFFSINNPNFPGILYKSLEEVKEDTEMWGRQQLYFEEYQRDLPPPGSPDRPKEILGFVTPARFHAGPSGSIGLNAFFIRKEGEKEYYRINVCRRGVVQVLDDFAYSGEDFIVAMRGEDWYIAFTKRFKFWKTQQDKKRKENHEKKITLSTGDAPVIFSMSFCFC